MSYLKLYRVEIIALIFIAFIILLTYWGLPDTFFQQDEWWAFGLYHQKEATSGLVTIVKEIFIHSGKIHYNPLAEIGFYLQFKLFNLHFPFYAYLSILLHIVNTILVFIFVNIIVRNRFLSFLSGLLFATNSVSHQAVSWIAASLNTQSATLFSLLFYILFLYFLKGKGRDKRILLISFLSLIVGLLFKEMVAPFLLTPLLYFFYYDGKKSLNSAKKILTPFIIFLLIYLSLRFVMYLNGSPILGTGNVELVQAGVQEYVYRTLVLPFRVITQSLIPVNYLLSISEYLIFLSYPQYTFSDGSVDLAIRETLGYDRVCFFISAFILTLSFFSYKYFQRKNKYFAKGIILFLLITVLSSLLIIFIPGKAGYATLIESRHLYSGSFGAAALLVLLLLSFSSMINKTKAKILITVFVGAIMMLNMWKVQKDISALKETGNLRKYILTKIASEYPTLSQNTVIYTQSDKSYYGMPDKEKILPVQVGFGWMLLSWFNQTENLPSCLYDSNLFLDILAEGYKECEGRGFGYYRDYDRLVSAVEKDNIPVTNIISYSWNSKNNTLTDITTKVKTDITRDIQKN